MSGAGFFADASYRGGLWTYSPLWGPHGSEAVPSRYMGLGQHFFDIRHTGPEIWLAACANRPLAGRKLHLAAT